MPNIGPVELIIILVIALLVLGPGRLPDVGSALGKSIREFRKAASDVQEAVSLEAPPAAPQAPAAPAAPAPTPAPVPNTLGAAVEPNVLAAPGTPGEPPPAAAVPAQPAAPVAEVAAASPEAKA